MVVVDFLLQYPKQKTGSTHDLQINLTKILVSVYRDTLSVMKILNKNVNENLNLYLSKQVGDDHVGLCVSPATDLKKQKKLCLALMVLQIQKSKLPQFLEMV